MKLNESVAASEGTSTTAGVLILLPVLNEAENIPSLLDGIEQVLNGVPHTVCIVDDGSSDGTASYVKGRMADPGHNLHLIERVKTARGSERGSALYVSLIWGLAHTGHEIFVEMDGDLSHRPEELPQGVGMVARGQCDVAIACKYMEGSRITNRPWGRRLVSRVCSFAVGTLITWRIHDYSNGYRFYTRAAARLVAEHEIRHASPIYLTEVLALWLHSGLRIGEFPTTYIGRNEGVSKLRFIDLFKAAFVIFEIAARYHILGFRPATDQALRAQEEAE